MFELSGMTFKAVSLGCKVNYYETEAISRFLESKGLIRVDEKEYSDITVVNTCTVTEEASRKSKQHIRRYIKMNPTGIVAVLGCLSQIDNTIKDIEGVSIILGTKNKGLIYDAILKFKNDPSTQLDMVDEMDNSREYEKFTINKFDSHTRAFMKIEDGCDNFCSYCIIPYARGRVRSRALDDCIKEAKTLVLNGHKEIVLTGIDTGSYGKDTGSSLLELLKALDEIEGLERIRISSIEITQVNEEIIDFIKNSKHIVHHIHIPIQSGSNRILKLMNRHYDLDFFFKKVEEIRKLMPDSSITTDLITGFPTETDEDHKETLNTLARIGFQTIHTFPYSLRKGTVAAKMEQLPVEIKKERCREVLEISKKGYLEFVHDSYGKTFDCIFETFKDGYIYGHTGNYIYCKMKGDVSDLNKLTNVIIGKMEDDACEVTLA